MKKQDSNSIIVTCEAASTMDIDELMDLQGGIKTLSEGNARRLRERIERHGINAPVFVWRTKGKSPKHYIIDGHQRVSVLRGMREEGYEIPSIPVVFIEAKSRKDAMDKLLGITSQYGEFVIAELESLAIDFDMSDLRIVDGEISFNMPDFDTTGEDEQGRLDHVGKTLICPHCGEVIDG